LFRRSVLGTEILVWLASYFSHNISVANVTKLSAISNHGYVRNAEIVSSDLNIQVSNWQTAGLRW
jgi:hypothetical protein